MNFVIASAFKLRDWLREYYFQMPSELKLWRFAEGASLISVWRNYRENGSVQFSSCSDKTFSCYCILAIQIQIRLLITNAQFLRDTANKQQFNPVAFSLRRSLYFISNNIVLNQQVESTCFLHYDNCLTYWHTIYDIYSF